MLFLGVVPCILCLGLTAHIISHIIVYKFLSLCFALVKIVQIERASDDQRSVYYDRRMPVFQLYTSIQMNMCILHVSRFFMFVI